MEKVDKITVEFVNQDKWGKHDAWATLRDVVSQAFPDSSSITYQNSSIGGVFFDYVNTGHNYYYRFGGVLLRARDRNGKAVIRSVRLDKSKQIDLDLVRVKHQELRDIATREGRAAQEKQDKDKVRSDILQDMRNRCAISSPDHLVWASGFSEMFTLTLRDVSKDQVESVMAFLHESGIRKEVVS